MHVDVRIERDDLSRAPVLELLAEHLEDMYATSPPGSVHALDITALQAPEVTFWSAWAEDELAGCCALKELAPDLGEIKSMRTPTRARRRGAGASMLAHVIEIARERGYRRLYLETGTQDFFAPARSLYRSHGFRDSEPFADYRADPNSAFFVLDL